MDKYTIKELQYLIDNGLATDISNLKSVAALKESYTQIGYVPGTYGIKGALLKGCKTGKKYALTQRNATLFRFC